MSKLQRIGFILLVGGVCLTALSLAERGSPPGIAGFVSTAQARIGRPLTPLSYAGVARRTVRRCAAGVYYC